MTRGLRRTDAALDARWGRTVALLRDLVRARASSGHETAAQEIVAARLREAGCQVEVFDVDAAHLSLLPGWGPTGLGYAGRPDVVGVIRGTGGGRSLILNAHVDAVAPGPAELWERDAWSAEIVGPSVRTWQLGRQGRRRDARLACGGVARRGHQACRRPHRRERHRRGDLRERDARVHRAGLSR